MNNEDSLVNDEGVPGHERSQRIAYLVAGYLEDNLSTIEKTELDEWLKESESNQRIFSDLTDMQKLEKQLQFTDRLNKRGTWDQISGRIKDKEVKRVLPWRFAAAAGLIFLIGFAIILLLNLNSSKDEKPVAFIPTPGITHPGDIDPGSKRATLQLGDGRIITLSDTARQSIGSGITNVNGQLLYDNDKVASGVEWHVLNTPAGGGYMITLPDESKVWLNASSSLRYPAVFAGNTRKVELKGEGYFEVKHNHNMAFVVKLPGNTEVTVLGTRFNVNAYHDEPVTKTTLLEGKVHVASPGTGRLLTIEPGQQVIVKPEGDMIKISLPDASEEVAWQKGYFEFRDATIESVMRVVARWYNAEIVYKVKPAYHFNAGISRDVPVSKLLQLLEMTHSVHFEVIDRKIIVKP